MSLKLSRCYLRELEMLPAISAVYLVFANSGKLFYIGQTSNLQQRFGSDSSPLHHRIKDFPKDGYVSYVGMPNDRRLREAVENALITLLSPPINNTPYGQHTYIEGDIRYTATTRLASCLGLFVICKDYPTKLDVKPDSFDEIAELAAVVVAWIGHTISTKCVETFVALFGEDLAIALLDYERGRQLDTLLSECKSTDSGITYIGLEADWLYFSFPYLGCVETVKLNTTTGRYYVSKRANFDDGYCEWKQADEKIYSVSLGSGSIAQCVALIKESRNRSYKDKHGSLPSETKTLAACNTN